MCRHIIYDPCVFIHLGLTRTHTHTHTHMYTVEKSDVSRGEHCDAGGAVGGVKGSSSPSLSSTHSKKEQLPFFSGIPSVEVVKGLLHLYKPKSVTCNKLNIAHSPYLLISAL